MKPDAERKRKEQTEVICFTCSDIIQTDAYLSLIYYHVLGAKVEKGKVTFKPYLPTGVNEAKITGFRVGNAAFDVRIVRKGGESCEASFDTTKERTVNVVLAANC